MKVPQQAALMVATAAAAALSRRVVGYSYAAFTGRKATGDPRNPESSVLQAALLGAGTATAVYFANQGARNIVGRGHQAVVGHPGSGSQTGLAEAVLSGAGTASAVYLLRRLLTRQRD